MMIDLPLLSLLEVHLKSSKRKNVSPNRTPISRLVPRMLKTKMEEVNLWTNIQNVIEHTVGVMDTAIHEPYVSVMHFRTMSVDIRLGGKVCGVDRRAIS